MTIVYNTIPRARTLDLTTGDISNPFLIRSELPLKERVSQLLRFIMELRRHGRVDGPGFRDPLFKNYADSASSWFTESALEFARQAIVPLANALQFPSLGGPIPVAYFLKTAALLNRLGWYRLLSLSFPKFAEGNQVLWQRIAEHHRVVYRAPVTRVVRDFQRVPGAPRTVMVETPDRAFEFDRLIWAAPLDDYCSVVDATPEEADIVRRIRNARRAVVTCRIDGVPGKVCYFVKNTVDHGVPIGYPYAIYEVTPGSGVFNLYPYMNADTTVDELVKNVYDLARKLGGTRAKLLAQPLMWKWFPYFSVEDFKSGIYDRFERLQGQKRTFFVGEILAGIGVAYGMEYAADVVDRYFPQPKWESDSELNVPDLLPGKTPRRPGSAYSPGAPFSPSTPTPRPDPAPGQAPLHSTDLPRPFVRESLNPELYMSLDPGRFGVSVQLRPEGTLPGAPSSDEANDPTILKNRPPGSSAS